MKDRPAAGAETERVRRFYDRSAMDDDARMRFYDRLLLDDRAEMLAIAVRRAREFGLRAGLSRRGGQLLLIDHGRNPHVLVRAAQQLIQTIATKDG